MLICCFFLSLSFSSATLAADADIHRMLATVDKISYSSVSLEKLCKRDSSKIDNEVFRLFDDYFSLPQMRDTYKKYYTTRKAEYTQAVKNSDAYRSGQDFSRHPICQKAEGLAETLLQQLKNIQK
jgi:hypothetical protein